MAFQAFSPLTTDDVINAVRQLPDKFLAADSIPTSIFKQIIDVIAPFVVALFNRSLAAGHFPAGFKEAYITPIVKSQDSMSQMFRHIGQFRTCRCCQSSLNALLPASEGTI